MPQQQKTKIAAFFEREGLEVPAVSRRADLSQGNVYDICAGRTVPKADTIGRLRRAASDLLGREIDASDLFDFGGEASR